MRNEILTSLMTKLSSVLKDRVGIDHASDRAASMIMGVQYQPESIERNVRASIEKLREAHCGGFNISEEEVEDLTRNSLDIIRDEFIF